MQVPIKSHSIKYRLEYQFLKNSTFSSASCEPFNKYEGYSIFKVSTILCKKVDTLHKKLAIICAMKLHWILPIPPSPFSMLSMLDCPVDFVATATLKWGGGVKENKDVWDRKIQCLNSFCTGSKIHLNKLYHFHPRWGMPQDPSRGWVPHTCSTLTKIFHCLQSLTLRYRIWCALVFFVTQLLICGCRVWWNIYRRNMNFISLTKQTRALAHRPSLISIMM